jgi:hypothetical protein
MFVDEVSVDERSLVRMFIYNMSVDEMSVDKRSCRRFIDSVVSALKLANVASYYLRLLLSLAAIFDL